MFFMQLRGLQRRTTTLPLPFDVVPGTAVSYLHFHQAVIIFLML